MNQFYVVGKVASVPDLRKETPGWSSCQIQLDVDRPFANASGDIETDRIALDLYRGAAETFVATARKNDWISARGRIESKWSSAKGAHDISFVVEKLEQLH